jgi:hypothetical protein
VSGPTYGTLTLSTNGGFTYAPATNFSGVDSFSYQANDGVTNSSPAIVTICVTPVGELFADDFARSGAGDPLAPWQVALGNWTITSGVFQGSSAQGGYSFAYVANTWTDYWVQGRVQFPAGAFGGGLGGRVNPVTGAHYAAWIYPEGSAGGSSVLKLFKFQNWTTLGYNGSSSTPMQQVSLAGVGTDWHTLKLAFHGSRIAVYFDGNQVISMTDVEPQPYSSGGIIVDMGTVSTTYTMSVDDIVVSPLVVGDNYSLNENTTLTVPAPGLVGNDTEVYGTILAPVVVSGPTNGTLELNPDGGFSYSPATNFAGADGFVYQANDGQTNLGTALVSITVNPALIVTADHQYRSYGAANPPLTGSIVGLRNGDNITANFSTVADTNSPVGAYPITITLSDPDHKLANYAVTTNNGTLTVNPAVLTVTAENLSKLYGEANPGLTATITGFVNGDTLASAVTGAPLISTTATTASDTGSYPITAGLGALSAVNYSFSFVNGTLTVNAAALTVTANDASRSYGATNPAFTATIIGIQNGDDITAAGTTAATDSSPAGTYPIVPSLLDPGSKLPNYNVTLNNGTLTVTAVTTPIMLSILRSDATNIVIAWPSVSNSVYRVQYEADLASSNWIDLTPDVTATGSSASFTNRTAGAGPRYYRVALLP